MKYTTFDLTIAHDRTCYDLTKQEQEGYITYTEYMQRCDELYNTHHRDEELSTQQRLTIMLTCWEEFLTV